MNEARIIYLIAGEPSGDALGAHLMQALKKASATPLIFVGVGGDKMEAEGLRSLFPYHELAIMGMAELLPHALKLLARIEQVAEDVKTKSPHALITIDSPSFCKGVVKKLRKVEFDTRYIHYVAPSVWAWRPKRAQLFADLFDHLLTLLPFEPPYFEQVGLGATFVGHPIVAETHAGDRSAFRTRYNIPDTTPLFTVLPGSRRMEIKRHLPIFARSIALLSETYPNLAICVPVPKYLLETVKPYFENCPFRAIVTAHDHDKRDAIAACNVAIVKSGTVTLEVAKARTPMVVAYRVSALSAFMFRRLRLIKLVTLINIVLKREAIPELLQEDCTPVMIATAVANLMTRHDEREKQHAAIDDAFALMTPLHATPSEIAARTVLSHL